MTFVPVMLVATLFAVAPSETLDREKVESQLAGFLKYPSSTGLMVYYVAPKSQAEKAGVKLGDILTQYDGQQLSSPEQLGPILRAALTENKQRVVANISRGKQEIPIELDAAPIGVRLFPVRVAEPRTLWHKGTKYEPNFSAIKKLVQDCDRFEMLMQDGQPVGWSRQFFLQQKNTVWMRVYWRLKSGSVDEKRDVLVSFELNKYLTLKSAWIMNKDQVVLDINITNNKMQGTKAGVKVMSEMPVDTVSGYVTGLLATTMPPNEGTCLRCSYLDSGAITPAPFADLYVSAGELQRKGESRPIRVDQNVFGQPVASATVGAQEGLLTMNYGKRCAAVLSTKEAVSQQFPSFQSEFGPIDRFPKMNGTSMAN